MLQVTTLHMDYESEVIGTVRLPQFGWVITSDRRGVSQNAYQLQIARDTQFNNLVYDSGVVRSSESAHISVPEVSLDSATRYVVRVKVQDDIGHWSNWCKNSFVTGLVPHKDTGISPWKADFISAETSTDASISKGTYLRKEVILHKPVASAYAFTTALGLYHFYINGKKVGNDEMAPGWTAYNKRLLYQSYDVTQLLCMGNNAMGSHIGAGWYKGRMGFEDKRNLYGTQTAFSAELHIAYTDGTTEIVRTDTSWKGSDSPVLFSEIYDGEHYDATQEQKGWNTTEFNDSLWRAVETVPFDTTLLEPQCGTRVHEIEKIQPLELIITPEGDRVINFGQNLTGWVEFSVQGNRGDMVELNCFEVLDAKGNVYTENLRTAKETIAYVCRGEGVETYHPYFTFQGFQYVKIAQWPKEIKLSDFVACVVHSHMKRTGFFECSHAGLNQLQHNIVWGLKGNFLDIPTDCPQRDERLGWTGDAQIFCRTASFLMNTYGFFHKWLQDVSADQTPEGGIPHVVPDILTGMSDDDDILSKGTHSATAWADVAVIAPWNLYLAFGDTKVIEMQYDSMKGWVNFMHDHAEDGLWSYKLQFGDWVALDAEEGSYFGATPNELTCAAYYAYSTGLFAKMAKVIGRTEDYQLYTNRYKGIAKAFRRHFFTTTGEMTAQTQTAHVLALYFDLVPEQYREQTTTRLVNLIEKEGGHLVTGFVGTPYICHALSQNGREKEAYELLLKEDFPSWLYQVNMGATTIWEHWDGLRPDGTMWSPDMNSFNHYAYGSIGEWLYRVIAGIEIDSEYPGYKHVRIQPVIGGKLTYAKGRYESIYGTMRSEWRVEKEQVVLQVEIPCNTTATVLLRDATQVLEHDGTTMQSCSNGFSCNIGSGIYTFVYIR